MTTTTIILICLAIYLLCFFLGHRYFCLITRYNKRTHKLKGLQYKYQMVDANGKFKKDDFWVIGFRMNRFIPVCNVIFTLCLYFAFIYRKSEYIYTRYFMNSNILVFGKKFNPIRYIKMIINLFKTKP